MVWVVGALATPATLTAEAIHRTKQRKDKKHKNITGCWTKIKNEFHPYSVLDP